MKSGLHFLLFSNFNRTDMHFSVPFLLFSNFNKSDIRTVLMVPNTLPQEKVILSVHVVLNTSRYNRKDTNDMFISFPG